MLEIWEIAISEYWIVIALFITGSISFFISTLGGGGGSLMNVPIVSFLAGGMNAAPIVNLGAMIGRPARIFIFWKDINWKIVVYYAPAAVLGALLGGKLFVSLNLDWIEIIIGLFLISTIFQYRFGKQSKSFNMPQIAFIPLGFCIAVLSTIIGAMGPVLNPFYLNAGIDKEEMIATKAANAFLMGLTQIGTYSFLGVLSSKQWAFGIAMGIGATVGNILGKRALKKMSKRDFRLWVIWIMVISGLVILLKHLDIFSS